MPLLINLKKAEHQNNELFVYCFRFCLAYSHLKSKFTASLSKGGFTRYDFLSHATSVPHDFRLSQCFETCFKMLRNFFLTYTTIVSEL